MNLVYRRIKFGAAVGIHWLFRKAEEVYTGLSHGLAGCERMYTVCFHVSRTSYGYTTFSCISRSIELSHRFIVTNISNHCYYYTLPHTYVAILVAILQVIID